MHDTSVPGLEIQLAASLIGNVASYLPGRYAQHTSQYMMSTPNVAFEALNRVLLQYRLCYDRIQGTALEPWRSSVSKTSIRSRA